MNKKYKMFFQCMLRTHRQCVWGVSNDRWAEAPAPLAAHSRPWPVSCLPLQGSTGSTVPPATGNKTEALDAHQSFHAAVGAVTTGSPASTLL